MMLCEEDLRKVVWLSDPVLSPDGRLGAFVREVSDFGTGRNVPAVLTVDTLSGEQRPASALTKRQTMPRFSPDGALLAFLSDDPGVNCLFLRDFAGGGERQLTDHAVSDYCFSPDSRLIAACRTVFFDRQGREMNVRNAEGYAAWQREMDHAPRFTEALMYKLDEAFGFLPALGAELILIDLETGAKRRLAGAAHPFALPSFSADGRTIYWYARPRGREKALEWAIYCCDLESGACRELPAARPVSAASPVLSRNGLPVYAGYCEERGRTELFAVDEAAGKETPLLPPDDTEGVDPALIGDDRSGSMGPAVRPGRDGRLCFLTARKGRVFVSDTEGKELVSGGCIQAFSAPATGRMLVLRSGPCRPGELFVRDLETGRETCLTHENDWLRAFDNPCPGRVSFGADGHTVSGRALLPEGTGPCPAVLYIHGGPECFYGEDIFFFEALTLCAAGFAVLWCNPRGSAGFGPDYARGAYGQEAVDDLLGFLDACIARFPRIDADRLGVTGGSYGGYMTNKLTLLTGRFRAAAAQRTWLDPATSYGTGDMGFLSGSGKTDFRAYMLGRARGSVLRDIGRLDTPTLILHGEKDVRCGEEQADQLFNMIRALRPEVPCRLVVFPGENHSLTRTGLMHHRIRHMQEIRQWMEKYLTDKEKTE